MRVVSRWKGRNKTTPMAHLFAAWRLHLLSQDAARRAFTLPYVAGAVVTHRTRQHTQVRWTCHFLCPLTASGRARTTFCLLQNRQKTETNVVTIRLSNSVLFRLTSSSHVIHFITKSADKQYLYVKKRISHSFIWLTSLCIIVTNTMSFLLIHISLILCSLLIRQ